MLSPAFVTPTPLARPPPTRLLHSRHRTPVAVAAHSLDHYRSLEGFSSPSQIFLPNAIIYSSLRRRLERSALAAAVDFITQLAGSSDVAAPAKSLSPREVVRTVLAALQRSDAAEVLTFASEKNRLKNCSPETLLSWLKASEYKFLVCEERSEHCLVSALSCRCKRPSNNIFWSFVFRFGYGVVGHWDVLCGTECPQLRSG